MAEHLAEEEQIEAIKRWWKESWKSIVFPVGAAIVIYAGWSFREAHIEKQAILGSEKYDQLVQTIEVQPGQELSDEQKSKAVSLANEIAENFSGTAYDNLATLILARLKVDENKLDEAEKLISSVVSRAANESTATLAKARLAKIYYAQGKLDAAFGLVSSPVSPAYDSLYAELRGDVLAAKGEKAKANIAYQLALNTLPPQQFSRRSIIQLKLDATRVPEASDTVAEANVDSEAEAAE